MAAKGDDKVDGEISSEEDKSDEEPVVEISNEDQNAVVPVVGVNRELDFSNQCHEGENQQIPRQHFGDAEPETSNENQTADEAANCAAETSYQCQDEDDPQTPEQHSGSENLTVHTRRIQPQEHEEEVDAVQIFFFCLFLYFICNL